MFPGNNLGIALHYVYRINFRLNQMLLYIILTATLRLHLVLFTLHYIKVCRGDLIMRCITLQLQKELFSEFQM